MCAGKGACVLSSLASSCSRAPLTLSPAAAAVVCRSSSLDACLHILLASFRAPSSRHTTRAPVDRESLHEQRLLPPASHLLAQQLTSSAAAPASSGGREAERASERIQSVNKVKLNGSAATERVTRAASLSLSPTAPAVLVRLLPCFAHSLTLGSSFHLRLPSSLPPSLSRRQIAFRLF